MQPFYFARCALTLAAAVVVATWTGCATTYKVKIDSVNRLKPGDRSLASYQIHNKNPVVAPDSLRYQEAARHVKTALSASGLFEAPTDETADMIVEIDYGMDAPRVTYEDIDLPVIAPSNIAPPLGTPGPVLSDGTPRADGPGERNGRELIGLEPATRAIVVCEKYMSVSGRENKPLVEGQPPAELWRVHVSIEDESRSVRDYLPLLASVAMDQFGKETNGEQKTTLCPKDDAVQFIKKGM